MHSIWSPAAYYQAAAEVPLSGNSEHPQLVGAGFRMAARKAAVDDQRRAVDVARLAGGEEQGCARDFLRLPAATEWIELADAVLLPALTGDLVHRPGHAGPDQAGADGIDPDAGAGQLLRGRLDKADHAGLRC